MNRYYGLMFFLATINWHCTTFEIKTSVESAGSSVDYSDSFLDSFQLIKKYQYKPERHSVITEDGYIVTLFRLRRNGPPVLMLHGIADSSDSWLVLGPEHSLAFNLADAGFDVWLLNARGNKYSKDHVSKIPQKKYWDFSFEEIGTRDLASSIDHILMITSRQRLSYVGFSQGTTSFFILCSLRPEYNQKIDQAFLLAPVAWMHDARYPFISLLSSNLDTLVPLFHNLGLYELYASNHFKNYLHAEGCKEDRPTKVFCDLEYLINFGIRNSSNLMPSKFPVIASHIPAGTSTKAFVHYMQIFRAKRFMRYDSGVEENIRTYNNPEPPDYDVSRVTVPVTIFVSESDWFSTKRNVRTLRKRLPNVVKYIVFNESLDFTHLEFVYGARVRTMVNDVIISNLLGS